MTTRRRRVWLPFSAGADPVVLVASGVDRIFVASITEAEVGRQYEHYTVERSIFNVSLFAPNTSIVTMGILMVQEDVAIATITPVADPGAQWLWHEEFMSHNAVDPSAYNMRREVKSRRIARGNDSELYFIIENRAAGNTITYHVSGRILVLL